MKDQKINLGKARSSSMSVRSSSGYEAGTPPPILPIYAATVYPEPLQRNVSHNLDGMAWSARPSRHNINGAP